ncbi:hypothetical protein GCM10025857_26180 [Alicyclobacillus contaminans]|uniref:hypothetical protein n=1 Tax=Alicyclobacillus contaminans TaxID=392016 RepID=UPI0009FDAA9E|nr:hypothetical protein GCM10025857_26180 [Alicyclobacillus contaminans]
MKTEMANNMTVRHNKSRLVWLAIGACCLLVMCILLVSKVLSGYQYTNLISTNSVEERSEIEKALKDAHIPWKVNGSFIEVPSHYKDKANLVVAMSGHTKQGQIQTNTKR